MTDPAPPGSIGKGLSLLALGHAGAAAVCAALSLSPGAARTMGFFGGEGPIIVWFFGIGLTQLVYAFPLAVHFGRRGETQTLRGVWIGALVTALINGTCWAVFAATFHP